MEKEVFKKLYKERIAQVLPLVYSQALTKNFAKTEAQALLKDAKFNVVLSADKTRLFLAAERLCSKETVSGFVYTIASGQLLAFRTLKLIPTRAGTYYFTADGVKFDCVVMMQVPLGKLREDTSPKANALKITSNERKAVTSMLSVDTTAYGCIEVAVDGEPKAKVFSVESEYAPEFKVVMYMNEDASFMFPPTLAIVRKGRIRSILGGNILFLKDTGHAGVPLSPTELNALEQKLSARTTLDTKDDMKGFEVVVLYL